METNTPKSSMGKQLLGGVMGMVIAGAIYFVATTVSTGSLGALLVDTRTVSENAHQVRVNDKTITEGELRLIATRARQVAALQGEATENMLAEMDSEPADATIVTRTAERREARRRFADDGTPIVIATATNENVHSGAPLQAQPEQVAPDIALDMPATTSTALPSSGFGTNALVVLALLGAAAVMRKRIFGQA